MIALLLGLFLLQAAPQGTGFVTGIVRAANGSPAPRVRVYAITYRDAVEAAALPPALESLTETDPSGRYRLELPPGRYHIATGSVAVPTYHPNTTDISAARIITVARDFVVQDIDFGTFVPATAAPRGFPPGNGVLSGVLRYPDGTPASGISVVATPVSVGQGAVTLTVINTTQSAMTMTRIANPRVQAVTDASGAYQIQNLGPESYHLVAGYSEAPVFYPGVPDVAAAKTVIVALNSKIDNLDFTVSRPAGVTVSGVVSTTSGLPPTGANVRIRNRDVSSNFGLPSRSLPQTMNVAADGAFSFPDVQPGALIVDVLYADLPIQRREVVVSGQQASGLQLALPVTRITGHIVMEDGSPVSNPEAFGEVVLSLVRNPNLASTFLPLSSTGVFSRLIAVDEFRFYLRTLPEEYEIKSVKSGAADLMKESLKVSGKELVDVEIRVARRARVSGSARLSGTIRDSISGKPAAGRIRLCCAQTGIAEQYSAPLGTDGSFEFSALPPGKYRADLPMPFGPAWTYIVDSEIEVASQGRQDVSLFTAAQSAQTIFHVRFDGADPVPENVLPSIVFLDPASGMRVIGFQNSAGNYVAALPLGARYDVLVENLPQGYSVKSKPSSVEPGSNRAVIWIQRTP
jgi:hypothetical protein